jgi:hypothetical protein
MTVHGVGRAGSIRLLELEADVRRQLDRRIDPALRFAVRMLNMNVRPSFFAGKEVEPKSALLRRRELESGLEGDREMSGATNEVGAPETGLWFSQPVLTPQADDLHLVFGPVVTARRYPITSCSKVTNPRSRLLLVHWDGSLTPRFSRERACEILASSRPADAPSSAACAW